MNITFTLDDLRRLEACEDGVEEFIRHYGEQVELNWTLEAQIEAIQGPLRRYMGWAWHHNVLPMWSMRGADLGRATLTRATLTRANLRGADLRGADLTGATLFGATLFGAILTDAILTDANLTDANLTDAFMPEGWQDVVIGSPAAFPKTQGELP